MDHILDPLIYFNICAIHKRNEKVKSYKKQKQKNKYKNTGTLLHLWLVGKKSSTINKDFAQSTLAVLQQPFLTHFLEFLREVCYLMLYQLAAFYNHFVVLI